MIAIREYVDLDGFSPNAKWFSRLNAQAAAKVVTVLVALEIGNLYGVNSVGAGVFELRIELGSGYRIYLGKDGDALVILLGGGAKRRQRQEI